MPHPTDETANTLPDPELNPLLNPVLAAHMGRWAEVYFTAPPERREGAILELLRELRNEPPAESASTASSANVHGIDDANDHGIHEAKDDGNRETAAPEEVPVASYAAATEAALICGVCAYQNATGQLFCGMCGGRLEVKPERGTPHVVEVAPPATADWSEPESAPMGNFEEANEPELGTTANGVAHYAVERIAPEPVASEPAAIEPAGIESAWTIPGRNLPHFAMEPEPESVPYRYRIYIGAVLAILLVLLLYMVWRSTQAISGTAGRHSTTSQTIPPAPPAAVPTPAEQPAAPAPAPSATPPSVQPSASARASSEDARPQPSTAETASPKATRAASPVRSEKPFASTARTAQPATTRPKSVVTMAASSSPMAADTSGAEELSSAERYLNGTPRDSRVAAQWLWKAVGKGNLGATIALSDLYLRGDGVPKSCDQARLLLHASARKGARAAGERLRNLQAFGCN